MAESLPLCSQCGTPVLNYVRPKILGGKAVTDAAYACTACGHQHPTEWGSWLEAGLAYLTFEIVGTVVVTILLCIAASL